MTERTTMKRQDLMLRWRNFSALCVVILLTGCGGGGGNATSGSGGNAGAPAQYVLTFNAAWSGATHANFPRNPHFSGLIGGAHTPSARLWTSGGRATKGIKDMAERGGKGSLQSEVKGQIAAGQACSVISGGGINPSPGATSVRFTVTPKCPAVSIVSMIAPSPDWFVGVSAVNLAQGNGWVDVKVVELHGYDAGTDSGQTHTAANARTAPSQPIRRIGSLSSMGTFTFRRVQ
ncbi:MAG: hypothetical protein ACI8P9_004554 [Parasphingorhabdus sp.]|jgi:hypothetical protein